MILAPRLCACLKKGNLTVADLVRWFERPDPTVRGWVKGGALRAPSGDVNAILARLSKLEKLIAKGNGFPVPYLSHHERKTYLAGKFRG